MEGQTKSNFHPHPDKAQDHPDSDPSSLGKLSAQQLLLAQLLSNNAQFLAALATGPPQSTDSLEQYLEMVKEINGQREAGVMSEKAALSVIEKSLLPILT